MPRLRAFLGLLASIFLLNLPQSLAGPLCNGHAELCSRKYSNVTFIGAHDSPFVGDSPADNQGLSVTAQLDAGIRFLQAQSHVNPFKTLSLCHTNCFISDAGSLTSYLTTIKNWLDKSPEQVLTLLLTNGDRTDIKKLDANFKSTGIDKYAYTPPVHPLPIDAWPTLGDLIKAKARLIVFLDYGANEKSVPYILDEFAYFFETPFDTTDPAFSQCKIDRPPKASPEGRMYIVNHYLDKEIIADVLVPDRDAAPKVNAATGKGSIQAQADICKGLYRRAPNAVLLDFFEKGEAMVAQRRLNGF
ncbi:MAG: hypothetical protein Q9201_000967 [Fulgogasparrea decipioides]